jgi:hypothetical protein
MIFKEQLKYIQKNKKGYKNDLELDIGVKEVENLALVNFISFGHESDRRESWIITKRGIEGCINNIYEQHKPSLMEKIQRLFNKIVFLF